MIREAAEFAEKAHRGAVRKGSDIPYITHPLETAVITSMMSDDDELIAAALLHDTMEDAGVSYEELKKHFGSHVADLVAEVTELIRPQADAEKAGRLNISVLQGVRLRYSRWRTNSAISAALQETICWRVRIFGSASM